MRLLFAVLLLANIGLLAWALQKDPVQESMGRPPGPASGLVLLTEQRGRTELPTPGSVRTSRPGAGGCLASGPLELAMLLGLQRALTQQGLSSKVVDHYRLEPLGFWVYLPPTLTLDAAQEIGQRLRQKGIDDFVYVVGAEKANAISLGLFATRSEAEALVDRLQQLGFSPRQEPRFARRTETYLTIPAMSAPPSVTGAPAWRPTDCQHPEESLP